MIRLLVAFVIYLVLSEIIEFGILKHLSSLFTPVLGGLFQLSLLSMAGILAGLFRGEIFAMFIAFFAALLSGFSQLPDYVGSSIVSFIVVAYLSGYAARTFRFQSFRSRWLLIITLLLIEKIIWFLVRRIFWPSVEIDIPVSGILISGLIGAFLMKWAAPRLKDTRLMNHSR
jgi:hypothetical protein